MNRLIDADALMETIRTHDYPLRDYFNSTDRGMFTSGIKQAVDEQPTIDAVEVVHGEWIEAYGMEEVMTGTVICSNCRNQYMSMILRHNEIEMRANKTPYCPNCGAKMRGEEKSDGN